ncbi:Nucleoside diphosphate-linked moiety X motif 13 [Armadillidium vulgare]|nr:Nucleoside diphosphate-linked moiety X motif 13 [Armadillidium vulgare]
MRLNLFGLNILKRQLNGLYSSNRSLSYVEKCRLIERLKADDLECVRMLPHGKFMVYKGSRPLLKQKEKERNKSSTSYELNWLTYKDLLDHKDSVAQTAVLIDVDDSRTPRFGIQLKKRDEESIDKLEKNTDGVFTDLRVSLFMVNWDDGQLISRTNSLLRFNAEQLFCSVCQGKMIRNSAGNQRKCSECKTTVYPVSNPVGIVLVTDPCHEHAVLVRQHRLRPGWFTCIAGFGDVGESLESIVKREVAEEVGLEVHSVEYVMSQHWPFPSSIMFGSYAVAERTELSIDPSELEDGRWFTRQELKEAVSRVDSNPNILATDPKEGIYIPPRGAVAYHLISRWLKNTNVKNIRQCVK